VIRQPELLLSKVNADDFIFCFSALFIQPGLWMISERNDQDIFVSQHSRKPHVIGSFFSALGYFVIHFLLSNSFRQVLPHMGNALRLLSNAIQN